MNKRAVIYCRVSTKEQVDEGNSLHTQEKLCREYALKNSFDVAEIFVEQGESAKTMQRTALKALLAYCSVKKNTIDVVITYKLDRISRNTDDYSQIRILLKRYGVEIRSTTEYFDTTSPAGKFMENIIANVAQFDNDVKVERCIGGMKDAMREGRYVWSAPTGYNTVKIAGKTNIVPNNIAPLVSEAFFLVFRNKEVSSRLLTEMADKGLVTRSGKPLARSHFYKMLQNRAYTGWIVKFGEEHKGLYQPIVSEELFNAVQKIIRRKGHKVLEYNLENPDFPLRRFVKHQSGDPITGGWSKGRTMKYAHYRYVKEKQGFTKKTLEEAFAGYVNELSFNESRFKKFYALAKKNLVTENSKKIKTAQELKAYLSDLEMKKSDLMKKNLKGLLNDEILHEHLLIIKSEILKAETSLADLPNVEVDYLTLLNFIKEFLKNPGKTWINAPFREQLELQWFKFPHGVTYDGKKFRTNEIANIFKVKDIFLTSESYRVPAIDKSLNNLQLPKSLENQEIGRRLFWQNVGKDIITVSEILKRHQRPP